MTLRFYADEDFPLPAVVALRALGHDVLTIGDDGRAGKSIDDEAVWLRAVELGRILLTKNRREFRYRHNQWLADGRAHCGLVACTEDVDFERLARRIDEHTRDVADWTDRMVTITRPQA